jgi:hypothetical protein
MLKNSAHKAKLIKAAKKRGKRAQGHNKCTECGACCYFYCQDCSAVGGTRFTNLCGPSTGRQCVSKHIQRALLREDEDED